MSDDVIGPVYEGEVVDHGPRRERFTRWWRYSSRVPLWLRDRTRLRMAVRELLVRLVWVPWRYARAVFRGLLAVFRWWRRWVKVTDYREAAQNQEKLADKFTEIRELTIFRWKVTGGLLCLLVSSVVMTRLVYGDGPLWITGAVGSLALAILGRRRDRAAGRKAVFSGPRSLTWTMDPQVLIDAFRDAKLIGKDETLRLVHRAVRQGDGWAVTVDLPATRKATDVIKNRDALASALAVDEVQLITERVRVGGGHAGRIALWVADKDPYASPPQRTPLLAVERWDVWRPAPFGRDARNRRITLPLVWTSLLIGAIPRQGKTFAARLAAAGLILDPYTRLYIADFKAGKDWTAASRVAHRFVTGDEPEHVLMLVGWLNELVKEVQARYRRMRDLDDSVCPESKVTPAMSRDPSLGMPITAVIIDEVQVPLEERTVVEIEGKRLVAGEYVGDLLTWLAKKGPAAGIVLILATQRPDSKTIPSGLRAVLGSRFALRVMDWRDSNIVLGEQMNTRGYDASRLLPSHKGVGILRPDGETDADVLALTVRTDYMPNEDWRTICERARALRQREGTLTGDAAGAERTPILRAVAAPEVAELPEPLRSVLKYLDEHGDGRDFVPTSELVDALGIEPTRFGRRMTDLGCSPTRMRVDGSPQVRGYLIAEIRATGAALKAA